MSISADHKVFVQHSIVACFAMASTTSPRKYYVQVPPGCHEGQTFDVIIDTKRITVTCPQGAHPGARLEIEAIDIGSTAYQQVVEIHRFPPAFIPTNPVDDVLMQEIRVKRRQSSISVWIFFTVLVAIFLILSYSVPKYATQYISSGCNAVNPRSNEVMSIAYYNMFRGFGSSPACENTDHDFCVYWSDRSAWGRFDSLGNVAGSYGTSTYQFQSAQVTSVLASAFCVLAISVLASALRNADKPMAAGATTCASYLIMITWLFALIAINAAAYASATSSAVWQRFFNNGHNIADLAGLPPTPVATPVGCVVAVTYEDGGALLSVAVAMAFGVSLSILLSMCCGPTTWTDGFQQPGLGIGQYQSYNYPPNPYTTQAMQAVSPVHATTAVYSASSPMVVVPESTAAAGTKAGTGTGSQNGGGTVTTL